MNQLCKGAALLLCVLVLAALSLLGLSAASDALLQERMGANRQLNEHDFRAAEASLRELEGQLMALPGLARPTGCPQACLADLPEGTELLELHLSAATTGGQPEISWFRLEARHGAPPVTVRSVLARPWGDAAWSGDADLCGLTDPGTACGRIGWERQSP